MALQLTGDVDLRSVTAFMSVTASIDTDNITLTYSDRYKAYYYTVPLSAAVSVSSGTAPSGVSYVWYYRGEGDYYYSQINTDEYGNYGTWYYPTG